MFPASLWSRAGFLKSHCWLRITQPLIFVNIFYDAPMLSFTTEWYFSNKLETFPIDLKWHVRNEKSNMTVIRNRDLKLVSLICQKDNLLNDSLVQNLATFISLRDFTDKERSYKWLLITDERNMQNNGKIGGAWVRAWNNR